MGWCYTFGIRCAAGCDAPMLVQQGASYCTCEKCGASCGGMFTNCYEIVFKPGGAGFQIRCLPEELRASYARPQRSPSQSSAAGIAGSGPAEAVVMQSQGNRGEPLSAKAPVGAPPHRRDDHRRNQSGDATSFSTDPQVSRDGSRSASDLLSKGDREIDGLRAAYERLLQSVSSLTVAVAELQAEVSGLRRDLGILRDRIEYPEFQRRVRDRRAV
jgi:hypothetical protein